MFIFVNLKVVDFNPVWIDFICLIKSTFILEGTIERLYHMKMLKKLENNIYVTINDALISIPGNTKMRFWNKIIDFYKFDVLRLFWI
jgi:hypothetical protein